MISVPKLLLTTFCPTSRHGYGLDPIMLRLTDKLVGAVEQLLTQLDTNELKLYMQGWLLDFEDSELLRQKVLPTIP